MSEPKSTFNEEAGFPRTARKRPSRLTPRQDGELGEQRRSDKEAVDLGLPGIGPATQVARGAYSRVFRAERLDSGKTVAIKVLSSVTESESARRKLAAETEAMLAVSEHPNVVTVYETGVTEDGHPYLVMDYVDGSTLQKQIAEQGALDPREVTAIGLFVASALEDAHNAGVVHGDVSPANVLLERDGSAVLTDFGMARLSAGSMTRTGTVTTAVAYAPPEVLTGERSDKRSDVYALGATLFAALSGAPAFFDSGDESLMPLIGRIASMPVPDLTERGVPYQLAEVVEKAMAKTPSDRYDNAGELRQALESAAVDAGLAGAPEPTSSDEKVPAVAAPVTGQATAEGTATSVGTPPPPPVEPGTSPVKHNRRRAMAIVGAVLMLALLATASLALMGNDSADEIAGTATTSTTLAENGSTPTLSPGVPVLSNEQTAFSGEPLAIEVEEMGPRAGLEVPDSAEVVDRPENGQASISDEVVTYQAIDGYEGRDRFTIRICYADLACFDVIIVLVVSRSPQAPDAKDDRVETPANQPIEIQVLENDGDGPEPDPGTLRIDASPPITEGRVSINRQDGSITFHPTEGFSGLSTFTYLVSSQRGYAASAKVTVNVLAPEETTTTTVDPPDTTRTTPPPTTTTTSTTTTTTTTTTVPTTTTTAAPSNTAPNAESDTYDFTFSSTGYCLPVLSNDSDDDKGPEPLRVSGTSALSPNVGSLVSDSSCSKGGLRYIPEDRGIDYLTAFTYEITDGLATDTATVSITIEF